MKIAYISDVVYPFVKGGAEKRIYEMGKRLATQDEVHVFGVKWWKGESDIELDGINIHGICKPLGLYTGRRRSFKEALRFAASLRPLLNYDFDIIDCNQFPYLHCFPARVISQLKDVSFVITWHEWWGNYWYTYIGAAGFVGKLIERATARMADQIIAVSQNTADSLRRHAADVSLVPNGVDTVYINSVPPAQCDIDALFVGRLIPEKHVDTLIRAVPADLTLCVIGDGPEKRSLMQLAEQQHKRVTFVSSLPYEDIIGVMKASQSLVLPSSREGFGIVALEALACGTPVITSNAQENAAAALIDQGENGFAVEIAANQIRSALLKIDKSKMGRAATTKAAKFDWNPLAEKLRREYQSLIRYT
ncbi:MAG: glycosyltransferase family 4 protein [Euryarchaeota archaeon]|nr:glycosyltransferase family 4 protein [Euryarchaeota archaeon]